MWNLILYIVGGIVGVAISVGVVYYFVANTKTNTKSPALAAVLSILFGPLIGFAYARPSAWVSGLVAEVFFVGPLAGGIAALASQGRVVVAGLIGAYAFVAVVVTAILMANDQNEHVEFAADEGNEE